MVLLTVSRQREGKVHIDVSMFLKEDGGKNEIHIEYLNRSDSSIRHVGFCC